MSKTFRVCVCERERVRVVAVMAELQREERERERERERQSEESVKLFVGQVPKHMTESQLVEMFQEFAIIDEVNIIKDKTTRASRGSQIYVTFSSSLLLRRISGSPMCNCSNMFFSLLL